MTRRIVSSLALLIVGLSLAHASDGKGNQVIPRVNVETNNYHLTVFNGGHFAVKIGGSWMPGCICLSANGVPQYKTEQRSCMTARVERVEGGRKIVISGRLTADFAFVETITALEDHVSLTYAVEALKDTDKALLRITAGPNLDHAKGLEFEIESADGKKTYTYTEQTDAKAGQVRSITWKNVGKRDARVVFEQCADASVHVTQKGSVYRVVVFGPAPMKKGEKAEARLRFEAVPAYGAENWVRRMRGKLGHTSFGVSGLAGLLHNIRTDRGLIIQQLSINEDGVHQVTVGRIVGREWGGVRVEKTADGCIVQAQGTVVNQWTERIEARSPSPGVDELRLTAHRKREKKTKRLRLLMYVARWLEDERIRFYIRTPDGAIKDSDQGVPLWMGMPQREDEKGLGPYRVLGTFPAATEIALPMLRRGEILRVKLHQPMEVSDFRFRIFFRGLWFQSTDPNAEDIGLTLRVERLPEKRVAGLSVWSDPTTGALGLAAGGIPLLEDVRTARPATAKWEWREGPGKAVGVLHAAEGLRATVPSHLWGKVLTVTPPAGHPYDSRNGILLRLGAEVGPVPLPRGTRLEFAPTALERFDILTPAPARLKLSRNEWGIASLDIAPEGGELQLTLGYRRINQPKPDPLASRPEPRPAAPDPGPYGGLNVKRDKPAPGDVTIETPWWEVVHSKAKGGAIASIRFFHGTNQNILRKPIETRLRAGSDFTDTADDSAKIAIIETSPSYVKLRVTGKMKNPERKVLCPFVHTYEYRPMLVRRTCEYDLGRKGVVCTGLSVGTMELQPWLEEAVARRANHRTTWYRAVFPGPPAFEENVCSQYMCLFKRGVEGIDWLPARDLNQWEGFATGKPGSARYAIMGDESGAPLIVIEPLAAGSDPVRLKGALRFESFLSLPQTRRRLIRRNFIACLQNGDCTEEFLKFSADYGVTDIMLGAANTPGTFRLSDLEASRRTVALARKYGIKVYPFDPFQLVNRKAEIWKHHEEWGRSELKNGKPELRVYSSYGDYFCATAPGFRKALKEGYKNLVESAGFGGLYHDFVHPYRCYNTRHYPVPHFNTDGVLDVILWERNFLGPDRVFCGHTGWTPVLFFQDLCTVTAVFEEYCAHEALPLYLTPAQGEFVNAAQRTLVSSFLAYGCVAPGEERSVPPPQDQVNAYLARCALVGIFPWAHSNMVGASDPYDLVEKIRPWYRLFAIRGKDDLASMQFLPYHRQTAVISDNPFVRAATYWSSEKALLVLANSESSEPADFRVKILPEQFGWPADTRIKLIPGKDCKPLKQERESNTFSGRLDGFDFAAYHATR